MTHLIFRSLPVGLILSFLAAFATAQPPQTQPAAASTQPTGIAQTDTPENSVRTFLMAMTVGDAAMGKACTLPADGIDILWHAGIPKDMEATAIAHVQSIEFTRLKVGDTFKLPRGQSIAMDEVMVNDSRQQIVAKGLPFPFDVEKQPDGQWKVDAGPMIAARQAAQRYRSQHAATKPTTQAD